MWGLKRRAQHLPLKNLHRVRAGDHTWRAASGHEPGPKPERSDHRHDAAVPKRGDGGDQGRIIVLLRRKGLLRENQLIFHQGNGQVLEEAGRPIAHKGLEVTQVACQAHCLSPPCAVG